MNKLRCAIVIPTYNGGELWRESAKNIEKYFSGLVIVIDSGSRDDTVNIAEASGFEVYKIASSDFNHGATRNYGVSLAASRCEVVVFMTQDAILQDENSIPEFINLLESNDKLAAIYGKQIEHVTANPVATHARRFNYSDNGYIVDKSRAKKMGLKSVFMSNSFAAYRVSIFQKIGGFASHTILCEDMLFAATALREGFEVGYQPHSIVRHSHNYSPVEEFKRYFDIGVFHTDQAWIGQSFGGTGSEGVKFIKSELVYLISKAPFYVPLAITNNFAKILGYKIGKKYKKIPVSIIKKLSMHKLYWH
jgi:rhamnosyltransferase